MKSWISSFAQFNTAGTMWIWFIPASFFTFLFSYKMVKYAEVIIEKTKFGGAFVGGVLISFATSLTELITAIFQSVNGTPEIGLSDDIGANFFNSLALAIFCLFFIKQMFVQELGFTTKIIITFSLILSIILAIVLAFGNDLEIGVKGKFAIGLIPFIFLIGYLLYVAFLYKVKKEDETKNQNVMNICIKKGIIYFVFSSLCILIFSLFLNVVVDSMTLKYNLSAKSAGGIFLSITTAMPEIVSLFLLGYNKQPIAAIASVIGSQLFNLSLIWWGDLAFAGGSIIKHLSSHSIWMIAICASIMLFLFLIFVIISKRIKNKYLYAVIPVLMIIVYIFGWIIIITLE